MIVSFRLFQNNKDVLINFGVSHNGIITYLYENSFPVNLSSRIEIHPWTQIGKISYEGKLIKITVLKPDDKNSEIFVSIRNSPRLLRRVD